MEILKGKVQDPGFPDTEVTYIKTDDGKTYFFIENGTLKNGNFIATPILKEGIGHAPYTSLGLITPNGEVLIPFENKNIQVLSNELLLVERNVPVTESVVEALKKQNDPLAAAELIESANTIKQQIKSVMGLNGSFIFDNQFSEATLYTTSGVNLANNYFSFIGAKEGAYFMSTNVVGSPISKYDPYAYSMQEKQPASEESIQASQSQENSEEVSENVENGINQGEESVNGEIPEISVNTAGEQQNEEVQNDIQSNENESINDLESQPEINLDIPLFPSQGLDENNEQVESASNDNASEENIQAEAEMNNDFIPNIDITNTNEDSKPSNDMQVEDYDDGYNQNEDLEVTKEEIKKDEEVNRNNDITDEIEYKPDEDETSDDDGGNSKDKYSEEEDIDDALNNPVIVNATNTIKKLLEENRKQRQQLDQMESEVETLTSSNDILKEDNDSKTKEIISLRNSMNKYRKDNTSLLKENKHLVSINSRQEEIINNLKMQNTTLKEQVAGITALNSAVAEANNLFTADDSVENVENDYSYLDESEDSYQYKKNAE